MSLHAVAHRHMNSFVLEYTDNAASEFVADSQQSPCEFLQLLSAARSDFFDASGMCTLPQRVKSAHNLWADWLSRGEVAKVIANAIRLGLKPFRVFPPPDANKLLDSLSQLT